MIVAMGAAGASVAPVSPLRAAILTAIGGAIGLLFDRAATAVGWELPSVGNELFSIGWKLCLLALIWFEITRLRREPLDVEHLGLGASRLPVGERRRRALVAIPAILGLLVLAGLVPMVIGRSSGSAEVYGTVHHAGILTAIIAFAFRYPLTVLSEEILFRGYIMRRLSVAPVLLSGICHAGFHWQQATTIPSLIPFNIALSTLVWWTGTVRWSIAAHYLADTTFFTVTYLL